MKMQELPFWYEVHFYVKEAIHKKVSVNNSWYLPG